MDTPMIVQCCVRRCVIAAWRSRFVHVPVGSLQASQDHAKESTKFRISKRIPSKSELARLSQSQSVINSENFSYILVVLDLVWVEP